MRPSASPPEPHHPPQALPDLFDISEKARKQKQRELLVRHLPKTKEDEGLAQLLSRVREGEDYRVHVPSRGQIQGRYQVDYFAEDIDPSMLTVWQPIEPPKSIMRNVFIELGGRNLEEQLTSGAFSNLGDLQFQNYCATLIQKSWRQYRIRKAYRAVVNSVVRLQRWWRRLLKTRLRSLRWRNRAAAIIQQHFRVWRDRRLFRFYKELVTSRQKMDPRLLLKAINIREASLIDAAAGIHVRLRLGGSAWPPLIFYKIFTHTPVIDINAFAPRDYAAEQSDLAARSAKALAQKSDLPPPPERLILDLELREYVRMDGTVGLRETRANTEGWYRRVEHNGWRPLADRVLVEDASMGQRDSRLLQRINYAPLRSMRKEERRRIVKQKKLEWLQKMYAQREAAHVAAAAEAAAAREAEGSKSSSAAASVGLVASASRFSGGRSLSELMEEEEGDDDESLIRWTEALDFDEYQDDWLHMATTASSTIAVPGAEHWRLADVLSMDDVEAGGTVPGVMTEMSSYSHMQRRKEGQG